MCTYTSLLQVCRQHFNKCWYFSRFFKLSSFVTLSTVVCEWVPVHVFAFVIVRVWCVCSFVHVRRCRIHTYLKSKNTLTKTHTLVICTDSDIYTHMYTHTCIFIHTPKYIHTHTSWSVCVRILSTRNVIVMWVAAIIGNSMRKIGIFSDVDTSDKWWHIVVSSRIKSLFTTAYGS